MLGFADEYPAGIWRELDDVWPTPVGQRGLDNQLIPTKRSDCAKQCPSLFVLTTRIHRELS
jgi:hypothetical protein